MDLKLFLLTFASIFLAELPDKTSVTILLLATYHHPLAVFLGASAAFVVQSLVAVVFGSLISHLDSRLVHISAGILFIVFAIMMWRKEYSDDEDVQLDQQRKVADFIKSITTAFITLFIAEWGDLTQLATATLAAKYHSPITIFTAATSALVSVTAIGVIVGHKTRNFLNPQFLQKTAACMFAVVGIGLLIKH
jgi:putative Ca2+/H+ antiporter (TMEM165/GDT1 family)